MKEIRRVFLLILFSTIFRESSQNAVSFSAATCPAPTTGVNPPNSVADIAGKWYAYKIDNNPSSTLESALDCTVCEIQTSGKMQCITGSNDAGNFYTGTVTYDAATKVFTYAGATTPSVQFVVSSFDAAKSSMVTNICYSVFVLFTGASNTAVKVGWIKGCQASTLTDITTGTNIDHQGTCKKRTFDFTKTDGYSVGSADTAARDTSIFSIGIAYDAACTLGCQCTAITNMDCQNSKCACKSGFCHQDGACHSGTGKAWDAACTKTCQCTGTPNMECSTTSNKCACKTNFCADNSVCYAEVALEAACTKSCQCTGNNRECSGGKCQCQANNCPDGTGGCKATGTALDAACTVDCECTGTANMACTNSLCKCKSTHCVNAGSCLEIKKINEACTQACQCPTADNLECATVGAAKQCKCKRDYCEVNGVCKQSNLAYDAACEGNCQCSKTNMECRSGKCKCTSGKCHATATCVDPPTDYIVIDNSDNLCMKRVNVPDTWSAAQTDCNNDVSGKSRLVVIKTEAKNNQVEAFIKNREPAWIGLQQTADKVYTYETTPATTFTRPATTPFQKWVDVWAHDNDATPKDDKDCIYMYPGDGKWADTKCDQKKDYVCELF